jgi:hypothetical protein
MQIEAEQDAAFLLHEAGFGPDDVPHPIHIAAGLGFTVESVRPALMHGCGELDGTRNILVRKGMAPTAFAFTIAHEVAEWHVLRRGYVLPLEAKELRCDSIAAALIAPWTPFHQMATKLGPDFAELAYQFSISETCSALRYGEVVGSPLAAISPKAVRVRGVPWGWPHSEYAMRLLAADSHPYPGLRKTVLADTRRVVLLAEA